VPAQNGIPAFICKLKIMLASFTPYCFQILQPKMGHQHSFYYLNHKMKTTENSLGTVVIKQGRTPTWTAKAGEYVAAF
jgi:hypothetical protein